MKGKYLLSGFIILIITSLNTASAGWVIYENNNILGTQSVIKIQNDRMISETDIDITIYDLENGNITLCNKQSKSYWTGNPQEYREGLATALKELLKLVDGELATFVKDMITSTKQPLDITFANNDNISFIRTSTMTKIGGLNSVKYDIFVNGRLYKNIWLTETITPFKNTNVKTYIIWNRTTSPSIGNDYFYEDTENFVDILKRGYITKTTNVEAGNMIESMVEKVEIKAIAESEFETPTGYTAINISSMLFDSMKETLGL